MIYERISLIVPKKLRLWVDKQLGYSDINLPTDRFIGLLFSLSFATAVVLSALAFSLLKFNPIIAFFVVFFVLSGSILFLMTNAADSEGKKVEKILPDALELIASNIKAGLTAERALVVSARPEFGALSTELKWASKNILSGERMDSALLAISTKIKSNVLDRTMWLMAEGIRNGGQIANLLIQLSNDLREENALKSEVSANISMYVMLIFFSAAFGAPMLFGISSFIVGVLAEQTQNSSIPTDFSQEYSSKNPALGLLGGSTNSISEEFIVFFVQIALFVTCLFASLILGIISGGNEKAGVKYFPVILIIAFGLFYLTRIIIASAFGGMIR